MSLSTVLAEARFSGLANLMSAWWKNKIVRFLFGIGLIFGVPIGWTIIYWCRQDIPARFKVLAICLQSTGIMIEITALAVFTTIFKR